MTPAPIPPGDDGPSDDEKPPTEEELAAEDAAWDAAIERHGGALADYIERLRARSVRSPSTEEREP